MLNREKIIRTKVKMAYPFRAKQILAEIAEKNGIELNDKTAGLLYKKIFSSDKKQGDIVLDKIGKVYENGFKAVHNFSLEIKKGEFISLLGPSGCGKTTILRMIAGLELISEGELRMDDVVLNSALPKERNLAMVFQNYALYPYMTVYDNIAFGLKIAAYSNDYSDSVLDKAINKIDPTHTEVKFLKAKIWEMKHKNNTILTELKMRIRKEKKIDTDREELEELQKRYRKLQQERKDFAIASIDDIKECRKEISGLKRKPSNEKIDAKAKEIFDLKHKNNDQINKLKEKPQSILDEITDLKENHKKDIFNEKEKVLELKQNNNTNVNKLKDKAKKEHHSGQKEVLNFREDFIEKVNKIKQEFHESKHKKNIDINELKIKSKEERDSLSNKLKDNIAKSKASYSKKAEKIKKEILELKQKNTTEFNNFKIKSNEKCKSLSNKLNGKVSTLKESYKKEMVKVNEEIKPLKIEENDFAKKSIEKIKKLNIELRELKTKHRIKLAETRSKNLREYKKLVKEYEESIIIYKKSISSRIFDLADLVGIRNYLKRKPARLSGGQRQRVALVRAISKDAGLFLFDEPLSNLDAKLRATMRTEIRQLHDKVGASSIFVTHDQIEAMTMSDRIALMNKGYIQQIGTPGELFNSPSNLFVADFIGNPSINLVEGKLISTNVIDVQGNKIHISKRGKAVEDKLTKFIGKDVILGIRPQNVITDNTIISSNKNNVFDLDVINIESIGHENILNLKSKEFGKLFRIMANRYTQPKPGSKIKIYIDPNTIQIFETETGRSISSIPNKATEAALKVWEASAGERVKNMVLADKESTKEKLSHKVAKDAYGLVNQKYGQKRKGNKIKARNKKYVDQSLIDQITGNGGN